MYKIYTNGMCDHEPLAGPSTDPDEKELQYFSRYEPSFKGLQKLVMDKQWLKSMKYYVSVGLYCSIFYYGATFLQ